MTGNAVSATTDAGMNMYYISAVHVGSAWLQYNGGGVSLLGASYFSFEFLDIEQSTGTILQIKGTASGAPSLGVKINAFYQENPGQATQYDLDSTSSNIYGLSIEGANGLGTMPSALMSGGVGGKWHDTRGYRFLADVQTWGFFRLFNQADAYERWNIQQGTDLSGAPGAWMYFGNGTASPALGFGKVASEAVGTDNATWLRAGSGVWNQSGLRLGTNHLWVDGNNLLRMVSTGNDPASDTDGTPVGMQAFVQPATAIAAMTTGPTLAQVGTPGSTLDCYGLVARNTAGTVYTRLGPVSCTNTAAATLNSSNGNLVTFPALPGNAGCFDVYRVITGGTPNTSGLLASCQTTSYTDQGGAASGLWPYFGGWRQSGTGLPQGCFQTPCTVAHLWIPGIAPTGNVGLPVTSVYVTPAAGNYRIVVKAIVTSAGGSGAGTVLTAASVSNNGWGLWSNSTAAISLNVLGTQSAATSEWDFTAAAAVNINVYTTVASYTGGTPVYGVLVELEYVGTVL
jgi:hypothetical protein